MSLIVNIDCATEDSLVQLAMNGEVIGVESNSERNNHAAFVHPAIERLFSSCGKKISDIEAVAVISGPGSYTGIRIGMATAKGLCLATNKPLILLNRLPLMAAAMKKQFSTAGGFYCPMIDARRMEVYCAMYSDDLAEIMPPTAHILSTVSFRDMVGENTIVISGSGAEKFKEISELQKLHLLPGPDLSTVLATNSYNRFCNNNFDDLVDSQPFYAKDFYNG